jgi:hypothetical protein
MPINIASRKKRSSANSSIKSIKNDEVQRKKTIQMKIEDQIE